MSSDGGVFVSTGEIYAKLLDVDKKVAAIGSRVESIAQYELAAIPDHDRRIASLEHDRSMLTGAARVLSRGQWALVVAVGLLSSGTGAGLYSWLGG